MPQEFYAHSHPQGGADQYPPPVGWQPLADHLRGVAELAREFAERARPGDEAFARTAYLAGLLHDLGKYEPGFQRRLMGDTRRIEHSGQGAAVAHSNGQMAAAFAVAGHHAGLPCRAGPPNSLKERCLRMQAAGGRLLSVVRECTPDIAAALAPEQQQPLPAPGREDDLRVRMLFSCLVDADRLDTEGFRDPASARARMASSAKLSPEERLTGLLRFIATLAETSPAGAVREARQRVLAVCLQAAGQQVPFFSLTVPTGGGKTLAGLAFALKHASMLHDRFDRIIIVIPYLSIIEQNASVYRLALGDHVILEHHSAVRDEYREAPGARAAKATDVTGQIHADDEPVDPESVASRLATENWDAPIVVTTSVRFFESLFSNRPTDCRRIHNIARAIVILDEVQTVPQEFLTPILSAMDGLAKGYGTTFVFSTATQPAFQRGTGEASPSDCRWAPGTICEILPDAEREQMFRMLQRVEVSWPTASDGGQELRRMPWPEVATRMIRACRALCIVNTREHARLLFERVREDAVGQNLPESCLFHLSTRMCPKHRLQQIVTMRRLLAESDGHCLVVSTQLVEAGVDIDFPLVLRAMAPFDSIVQAAGRCDREGTLTAALGGRPGGRLEVFESEDGKAPGGIYTAAIETTRELLARSRGSLSIHDPRHVRKYYDSLYGVVDPDARQIEDWRRELHFPEVSERFQLIADVTRPVLIPWDQTAIGAIAELEGDWHGGSRRLWRVLQPYVVGLYPHEFRELATVGAIRELRPESGFWAACRGIYDPALGLTLVPRAGANII